MVEAKTEIRISQDLSFVEIPGGKRVNFTRSERCALALLMKHPDRLITRDQLLDTISGPGSDKNDRNIDFIINRLRRKIQDDARSPRYIATRYGEGYVWIGANAAANQDLVDVYLVVGPLRGLDNLAEKRLVAQRFAVELQAALRRELPADRRVVLISDAPPSHPHTDNAPSISVELTFFDERGAINCIVTVRTFGSGRLLTIQRVSFPEAELAEVIQCAGAIAPVLLDRAWQSLATQTETGLPLPLLMHEPSYQVNENAVDIANNDGQLHKLVSVRENRFLATWRENEKRLLRLRSASPDDPTLKIMYATQIHSKYITLGPQLFQAGVDDRSDDEAQIESLVLSALPHIQDQPEYVIMAAKLLHFLNRGYFDLSRTLAEEAYASSIAAAGSLAIVGQLRAFSGETDAALKCLNQALNLVAIKSTAYFYIQTIKLQTLLAKADYDRLNEAKHELYRAAPGLMFIYEPMFANPAKLSMRAKAVMIPHSPSKSLISLS